MGQVTYLTLNDQEIAKKERERVIIRYDYIILGFLAFLLGQAEFAGGVFPLVLVYWITVLGINRYVSLMVGIILSMSLVWTGDFINLKYSLAGFLGFALYKLIRKKIKNISLPLVISLFYLLAAILLNYYQDGLLYKYLLYLGESIFIFVLASLNREGFKQLIDQKRNLTTFALITVFVFSAGMLIGLANLPAVSTPIINIVVLLFLLGLSYQLAFSYSTISAVLYGLVLIAAGIIPVLTMVRYILCALSCSMFSRRNKLLIIVGAILTGLIYSGFSPTIYDLRQAIVEIVISCLFFMIIPLRAWSIFDGLKSKKPKTESFNLQGENLANELKQHLVELARVFAELSSTFKEVVPEESENRRTGDFIFIFKNKVCSQCNRKNICWQQERDKLVPKLIGLLNSAKSRGNLDAGLLKKYLADQCLNSNRILASAKVSYEIYLINSFWRDRLNDKQEIVSEQLSGISQVIEQFSETELNLQGKPSLESVRKKAIKSELGLYSIEPAAGINTSGLNFLVEIEPCSGNKPCQEQLPAIFASEYNVDFRVISRNCGQLLKDEPCRLLLGPVGHYNLNFAKVQQVSSGSISGDSFLCKSLQDGKDLIVLSDGMGVGKKASIESKAAINLLEKIIKSGFDQELAIKTINSALFLRNQEESFTTLDIGIFDTFTGRITFNKIGAVASYIKRGWDLIKIDSASLPVGILDKIDFNSKEIVLENGDFVIMFTDGVLDSRYNFKKKEDWFRQLIQNSSFDSPQDLVDYIMEVIMKNNTNIKDDMTIIVFKVEEKAKKRRIFTGLSRIN